jgi:hypothetical protein
MVFPQHGKYASVSSSANSLFASAKSKIGMDDIVAGGSETQLINLAGMGRKQMGHSSFAGGSLKRASSRSSAARILHSFLCFGQWFF